MASMGELKKRRDMINSISQITKAMELVSRVKLQRVRPPAENVRPYFDLMDEMVRLALSGSEDIIHPYLTGTPGGKKAVILITSNRGLAGGYNSNILRMVLNSRAFSKEDTMIYPIGAKGREYMLLRGYVVGQDFSHVISEPGYADVRKIADQLLGEFAAGGLSEIYLAYTRFINTMAREPVLTRILPVEKPLRKEGAANEILDYEMEQEETLSMLVPRYIAGLLQGALLQSAASEHSSRMQAMEQASDNAQEMMEKLETAYNRARQSAITRELTEIIAGAGALD